MKKNKKKRKQKQNETQKGANTSVQTSEGRMNKKHKDQNNEEEA